MFSFKKSMAFQSMKNFFKGSPGRSAMNTAMSPMSKGADYISRKASDKFGTGLAQYGKGWRSVIEHRTAKTTGRGVLTAGKGISKVTAGAIRGSYKAGRGVYKSISMLPAPVKMGGLALGAVAMIGVGIMRGALNESKNIVFERYMQDMTYSRSMASQSRVGLAHTTHNMLNNGGIHGLSNALSTTRHGRY